MESLLNRVMEEFERRMQIQQETQVQQEPLVQQETVCVSIAFSCVES